MRRGDHQVELAGQHLGVRRVEDVFAVLVADARRADRAHEGHARQRHRGRGGDHRQQIGLVLAVIRQNLRDAVDLVVEAFGEQRADRTVDQAADQRLTLGRATLALEEAAGDAARSRKLFLVVDGEREEILPFLHRLGGGHGAEHHRLAERRDHRAVGLAGDLARFEGERLAAPLDRYLLGIEHVFSFTPHAKCVGGPICELSRLARCGASCRSDGSGPNCPSSAYPARAGIRETRGAPIARIYEKGDPKAALSFHPLGVTCEDPASRSGPDTAGHRSCADSRAASAAC